MRLPFKGPYTYLDVSWGAVTDIKTQLVDDSVNTAWARRFANEGPEQGSRSTSWYVRTVAACESQPACQSKGRLKCRWVLTVGCNCHSVRLVPSPGSHLALLWCFTPLWLLLTITHTNTQGKLRYELHFNMSCTGSVYFALSWGAFRANWKCALYRLNCLCCSDHRTFHHSFYWIISTELKRSLLNSSFQTRITVLTFFHGASLAECRYSESFVINVNKMMMSMLCKKIIFQFFSFKIWHLVKCYLPILCNYLLNLLSNSCKFLILVYCASNWSMFYKKNTISVFLLQNLTIIQCVSCRFFVIMWEMYKQFVND